MFLEGKRKEDTRGRLKELCETITNMLLVLEFGWSGFPDVRWISGEGDPPAGTGAPEGGRIGSVPPGHMGG